jgi:plasmid stability protein
MSTLTIRGCDDALSKTLHVESEKRGISINRFVLDILRETFRGGKRQHSDDGLSQLAGTWSEKEAAAFAVAVADFETIDPDEWR